MNSTC